MKEWMMSWNKEELFYAGHAKRIPFAKVNTMKDIRDDVQLNYRNYFVELDYPGRGKIRVPAHLPVMASKPSRLTPSRPDSVSTTTKSSDQNLAPQ